MGSKTGVGFGVENRPRFSTPCVFSLRLVSIPRYIAPQTAAAVALCVTDSAGVQHIGRRAKLRTHGTLTLRPNSHT